MSHEVLQVMYMQYSSGRLALRFAFLNLICVHVQVLMEKLAVRVCQVYPACQVHQVSLESMEYLATP